MSCEKDQSELTAFDRESGPIIMTESTSLFESTRTETFMATIPEDVVLKYGMDAEVPVSVEVKEFTLYYGAFDNTDSAIHSIIQKLREGEDAELTIRIDSPGGSFNEGLQLLKVMRECYYGKTTTHLDAEACSMGALVFVAGHKRVVDEYSSLMLHNYSAGIGGSGSHMKAHLENNDKIMMRFSRDMLVKPGFIDEAEYSRMVNSAEELWFNAEQMCYRGIATHVDCQGFELTAQEYVDFIASELEIEDFLLQEAQDGDTV